MLTNEQLEEIQELARADIRNAGFWNLDLRMALMRNCDNRVIEEMATEILSLRAVLDGLPPEAIAGGWTAKGISAYAKKLELQLAELGKQEPVAWTDEQELRDVEKDGCGYLFTVNPITPNADMRRVIPLFKQPPLPVVPDKIDVKDPALDTHRKWMAEGWNRCRTEILQSGNPVWIGIDWAEGCWPSSVIPDSFAIVPKVATDEMICAGLESTGTTVNISDIWNSMVAVSPQPNKGEYTQEEFKRLFECEWSQDSKGE
ncbi:hypothetical protein AAGW04_19620 [Pectobacterium aroidearum]|uniref:hypothetical protein n=1 Tax=Pectobacterium aroidearum TaxID=1201031 RepID=UPI0031598A3C